MPSHDSPSSPPLVLVFAATDPTGGAGIQADLLTLASMGCHGLSVVTAITIQDTAGVDDVMPIDSDWVADQARTLLEDMPVAAFKVGMMGSVENIAAIAEVVADYPDIPLILDPVLASGRGDELASEDMIAALTELLLPQTTIITPNSPEARRLARALASEDDDEEADENAGGGNDEGRADEDDPELAECASRLLRAGCEYVLITGTHENTPQVVNTLYGEEEGELRSDAWERLPGSYHGSGCTLASAIAAMLANGLDVSDAVREAQEYTWQALAAGFRPGMGQHLPDRFFWAREGGSSEEESGDEGGEAENDERK
ncbi:MAG TPA: hydroxymethylpyrimidine/phosphomethylpyrimidine kinase [Burkholderiales bacterium]|nr:hydroxymethylpyrimidine/phosphomethylpyrimidine kinase [Burkholderiales bacterium]